MILDIFRAAHEARPHGWGDIDCCMALADWAIWLGHEDPACDLRGTYDSEEGCKAIVAAMGGLLPLVGRCCHRIGWERTERVETGVIGVIGSPTVISRQWGAIRDGSEWLVRAEAGFLPFHASAFAMWRPTCLAS